MIWLTGARGMLGREVAALLEAEGRAWVGSDREVDLGQPGAAQRWAREAVRRSGRRLRWVINCAAYTAVDRAEEEPEAAWRINAEAPGYLAELARESGAALLHLSTDYVFGGEKEGEYGEEDPVRPLGAYGLSKAEGEERVRRAGGRYFIVRTAWLYGRHGTNFVSTMLRLFGEREEVGVVADQWGSPTWARDLARALAAITAAERLPAGIYHFTNAGRTTWYGLAREIQRQALERGLLQREVRLKPLATAEYPTRARRPANSCLSLEKIRAALGLSVRPWPQALGDYLEELKRQKGETR